MNKTNLIVLFAALTLSACALLPSKPLSPEEAQAKREEEYRRDYTEVATHTVTLKGQEIKVIDRLYHPRDPRDSSFGYGSTSEPKLVVIQRSDTVGATALTTLTAIARTFVGGSTRGFSKHDLRGSVAEPEFPNPAFSYLSPKIRTWLVEMPVQQEVHTHNNIYVQPGRFYLVYEKLSGGGNYLLHNEIYLIMSSGIWGGSIQPGFSCTKETGGHSLEDWRKDGDALVRQTAEQQFDECLEQFKANQDQVVKSITRSKPQTEANNEPTNNEDTTNERPRARSRRSR